MQISLKSVLYGVAEQLVDLELATARIEDRLAARLSSVPGDIQADAIGDFQAVDLLRQTLRDLGALTRAASQLTLIEIDPKIVEEIQKTLTLTKSKNLLSERSETVVSSDLGDLDFFL